MALTVDRVFLGWDLPALPSAAAHLIEHYADGAVADLRRATLVLPGGRSRRRIIELLLDEAEARSVTLIPPAAATVGRLPELLYVSPKAVADDVISRRAWSQALRGMDRKDVEVVFPHLPEGDSLAEWDELAALLAGLHQNLAGEGHRFQDLVKVCGSGMSYDDGPRWEALGRVQRRYLQLLEKAGLADRFEARMAALTSEVAAFRGDLWLVSIVELPAVTRRLMEAGGAEVRALIHAPEEVGDGTDAKVAFDTFGLPSTDHWERAPVPVGDQVLEVVERPVDQAEAVINALTGLRGKHSAGEVVLGVHLESEVVPYLEQRLEVRGVPPRYAAGTPLSRTNPVRLLRAVADFLDNGSFEALAALLRHPDAGALTRAVPANGQAAVEPPSADLEAVDWADGYFNTHLPFAVSSEMPPDTRAPLPRVVRAIAWDGPLKPFTGLKRLSQWMPLVMDVLLAAYGQRELDRGNQGHRRLLDTLGRIRSVAASLAALPATLNEECTGSGAIRTLLLGLRDEALPPEPDRDAVELLNWLELPLDDAPVVVLTGFNEGFLPESVSGHAFLPDALRTRLGLPDNRSRLARDAYRLTTVLHSKASVLLIAGRRTAQGDPLRPSRLMFRIPEEQIPARVLQFLKGDEAGSGGSSMASLGLQPGEQSEFTVPPEEAIELGEDEIPKRLAVTAFKSLLSDPYRFVLEHVYRLESVDDAARELDPLGFGSLAHNILERFGSWALESPRKVDVEDESAVAAALMTFLDEEMSTRFGEHALPAVYLQAEQLKARLRAFAERQAEWAAQGWRIAAVECMPKEGEGVPFDVDGMPFILRGRIDRIDHNAATGEWAVLDYKTGTSVDPPEKTHRRGKDADRRWVDLQLPLYRLLLAGILDAEGRRLIDTKAVEQGDVHFGYVSLPKNTEDCKFMLADWSEDDFASAELAAQEAIRTLRKGTFEYDRDVTKVGWHGGDPLKPLLTVGWQGTGGEADAVSDAGSGEEDGGE